MAIRAFKPGVLACIRKHRISISGTDLCFLVKNANPQRTSEIALAEGQGPSAPDTEATPALEQGYHVHVSTNSELDDDCDIPDNEEPTQINYPIIPTSSSLEGEMASAAVHSQTLPETLIKKQPGQFCVNSKHPYFQNNHEHAARDRFDGFYPRQ